MIGMVSILPGCAELGRSTKPHPTVILEPGEAWRHAATLKDEQILNRLPAAWAEALAQARKAGFARAVAKESPLFEPAAALPRPSPPPGAYACRLFTLGAAAGRKPFVAGRSFFCFVGVEGSQLSFIADLTPLRVGGYLWEQDGARQVTFLGSSARGKATRLPPYGATPGSDVPGIVERIGDFRYRLVLASSVAGGQMALLELKPVVPPG